MSDQDKVYLVRAGRNGEDEEYVLENNRAINRVARRSFSRRSEGLR